MSVEKLPSQSPPASPHAGANPAPAAPAAAPGPAALGSVAVARAPEAFGGHKGGGKKRADGLKAGSPEAVAADKAKDALRKREARAAKSGASLPPTLPPAPPAAPGGGADVAPDPAGGVAGDVPPVAGVAGALVSWSGRLLARPWKLVVKIADRLRVASLRRRVDETPLPEPVKQEIRTSLAFAEESKVQLADALANASAIELNKRQVGGAQHSHWLDVGVCALDLTSQHFDTMDKINEAVGTYLAAMEKAKEPAAVSGQQAATKPENS